MNEPGDSTERDEGQGGKEQQGEKDAREFGLGTLARTLGELGFCLWIVVDLVRDPGIAWWLKTLLWLAASLAFFDVAHTIYIHFWRNKIWVFSIYGGLSVGLLISAFARRAPPEPQPNMILSLQVGDAESETVFLTNDFLFSGPGFLGRESSNGPVLFKSYSRGCIVVPVRPGESNKVFNFTADNESEITYRDLEVAIAFPKDWTCSADPKWEQVDELRLFMPGWKVSLTNLQVWAAQTSKVLYPWHGLRFPSITNNSITTYSGPQSQAGIVLVVMRSTNLYGCMGANVVFFPARADEPFRPFAARTEWDSNGVFNIIVPSGAGPLRAPPPP